jgi:hypothetical protein
MEWIKVEDQLPARRHSLERGTICLIAQEGEIHAVEAIYDFDLMGFYWAWDELDSPIGDVTHWMPMPPTPKR